MTTDGTAGRRATLAVIAWMLAATGLTACSGGPYGSGDGPDAPTGPSATFRTMPEWDAESGGAHTPIEPGTYLVPRSPWSVADFTVTFPAGWTVQYGHVYGSNAEAADEFGFYAVVVDEVFHDSCAPEDETTRAVGPGIDDLGTALREQLGGAAVSEPVSTTLGGYPATRIDLEVPEQVDVARCRLAPVGLQIWYSEPADKYFVLLAGATASVYVVAVDGRRQVFLTQVSGSTSAADRAELQAVLDSIRIEGSSSTSDQSPTSTASAADGSLYFAADTRGGDDLMDPVSFEQGEFHPKPPDIYLSRRGAPVRRVVASHGSDRCPRVAPDGDHLAYLQDSTLVIARLDAAGEPGGPRVRTHLPEPPSLCPQWSPDGRSVGYVVFTGDAPLYTARPAEVRAVSLAGEDRVVASFGAQTWHQPAFAWSPDGKEVAYTTETGVWRARPGGRAELLWRPAAGDPSQELPMAYDRPTSLAWSRRGEIAFTVYASEPDAPDNPYGRGTETWAVRVIDPEIRRVERLGAISYGGAPAWSPDGGQLAFRGPDGRIRVHDRASGSTTRVPGAGGRVGHGDLAWSPDGDRLLTFTRADAKGDALVSVLLDGSTTERRSPWTWALDWIAVDDVDWSSR